MRYRQSVCVAALVIAVNVAAAARADEQLSSSNDEQVQDRGCEQQQDDDFRSLRQQNHRPLRRGRIYAPAGTQPYWGTMRPYWGTYEPPGVIHRGARTQGLGPARGLE